MRSIDIKNLFRSLTAACVICAAMSVSCEEPTPPVPPVEPVFPSVVEKNDIEPGSVLTLSFEANMDWAVTVPSEGLLWFWIQDGDFKVDRLTGKVAEGDKEKITVSIGVSETEEFEVNRSCDVTLTMGGKSQVIARYMRPAMSRTISVYAAEVADGAFVLNDAGGYQYESAEISSLDFIWSAADADFRMPVKVESNCEWTAEVPEWVDMQVPESTTGVLEIVLTGASVEAASGKITFKAGSSVLKDIEVNVPPCGVIDVYSAQLENDDFLFDGSGDYLYTEKPVEEIRLIWPASDFRMPVMVDSRCDWTLELPEWLTVRYDGNAPESNSGVVRFLLMGDPKHYPLEETVDQLVFRYEDTVVKEIPVTIPGCKDMFGFGIDMSLTSWEFNPEGYLMTTMGFQDMSATAWFTGTSAAAVHAVETVDGKYTGNVPEWLTVDVQPYIKGDDVLQQRSVLITPSENDGVMRTAYVLFSNDGSLDSFFASDGTLKPEKEEFAVSVVQYGSDMDYVTMISSDEDMALAGVSIADADNPRLSSWFGQTDFMYEITYSNPYARDEAFMSFAKPYASFRIFDNARNDVTSDMTFWLRFTANDSENRMGVIDMYNGMTPSETKTVGYVVFYDEDDSVLAVIVAVFDPDKFMEEDVEIKFIGESADYAEMVGATLEKVTEETDKELYDMFKEYDAPIYHLTYRMLAMPMRITIPPTSVKYNPNPYQKRNIFRVNNLDYDESAGEFELIEGGVDIYMSLEEGSASDYERGQIIFHRSDMSVSLVLVCTLDLTGTY